MRARNELHRSADRAQKRNTEGRHERSARTLAEVDTPCRSVVLLVWTAIPVGAKMGCWRAASSAHQGRHEEALVSTVAFD